ncbi:hypothetical protein HZ326_4162 [Fusarium oxysporum f. sp. albedinis]|nr:hypothetical protein HZ326_4162 [Fusarium oxysporum f. sp. albedinis]
MLCNGNPGPNFPRSSRPNRLDTGAKTLSILIRHPGTFLGEKATSINPRRLMTSSRSAAMSRQSRTTAERDFFGSSFDSLLLEKMIPGKLLKEERFSGTSPFRSCCHSLDILTSGTMRTPRLLQHVIHASPQYLGAYQMIDSSASHLFLMRRQVLFSR